jgi:hypothetical protein
VLFSDKLHMKVYWSERHGAILTSANLSTNAMGSGALKEIGVQLPPRELSISKVISSLKARRVTPKELKRLDQAHDRFQVTNRLPRTRQSTQVLYPEWYASPMRRRWFLGWWDAPNPARLAEATREILHTRYNRPSGNVWLESQKGSIGENDWILHFKLTDKGATEVDWMYADHLVKVGRADKARNSAYPFQIVQVWPPKHYPPGPFAIDAPFRSAFAAATKELTPEYIKGLVSCKPTPKLLDRILKYYKQRTR